MALAHITDEEMAAAGVASAPDILTGTPSEVKAIFDNLVRAVVATAVNLVVDEVNSHEANIENPHAVTKAQVGLGAADNTADADKPVSGPQQTALNLKADKTNVLEKDNSTAFTPTGSYHPATKGYVDQTVGAVVLGQIPDNNLTTAKLADGAVTMEKLADGAATTEKLADGAVTMDKISESAIPNLRGALHGRQSKTTYGLMMKGEFDKSWA